jgi:hypothetical protein
MTFLSFLAIVVAFCCVVTIDALRCTVNDTSPLFCELAVFQCNTTMSAPSECSSTGGDFRSADLQGAVNYCESQNMSLVTPLDRVTLTAMATLCTTTFVAAQRDAPSDCRYRDIDDNVFVLNDNSTGLWNVGEPTVPAVQNCTAAVNGNSAGLPNIEPCVQLLCTIANVVPPMSCSGQVHDRMCRAVNPNRLWSGAQCTVCGRRPVQNTTVAITTSTVTTSTTTASTTATSTATTSSTTTATTGNMSILATLPITVTNMRSSADSDSTLTIVLAVLGGLLLLVLIAAAVVVVLRRRRREQQTETTSTPTTTTTPVYSSWKGTNNNERPPVVYDAAIGVDWSAH